MTLDSNSVETSKTELLRSTLENESSTVFAVGFDETATEPLLEILEGLD